MTQTGLEEDLMNAKRRSRTSAWIATLVVIVVVLGAPPAVEAQRDRGINQPGAVGNRPGATATGYGGSARQVRAVSDPGRNQPGAVGNAGRDPGKNQPGAVGNPRR